MLNVLYTTDNNYFKYMLVSLYSLLRNNKAIRLNIYILCSNIDKVYIDKLNEIIKNYPNATVNIIDDNTISNKSDEIGIPKWRNTSIANTRLFISEIIKDNNENILYLDSDTLVVGSLKGLLNFSTDKPLGAVKDLMPSTHYKNIDKNMTTYFNSGVLYFNRKIWDINNCQNKIIQMMKSNTLKLVYPDQDILNKVLINNIEDLGLRYNILSAIYLYGVKSTIPYKLTHIDSFYTIKERKDAIDKPIIIHCTACYGYRPWDKNGIHPHKELYFQYMKEIFPEENLCNISIYKETMLKLLSNLKLYCPNKIKKEIKKLLKLI